ncbi:hsp90-like protein [Achlya hypogyna]|uniref:Hsp90-like protein n=1 Tax=Achlya hypogyna TaxID=1202772 RepID=A0A1V9Z405_ACHHY|nr:hsp90-like protein [Achlya hypogyna]
MFGSRGMSRHSDVLECAIPTVPEELLRLVEELKRRGNQAFSANVLEEAEILYSHAIDIAQPTMSVHILYSNRSATRLKMGKLELALEDAEAATTADASFAKGYFRKGQALTKLKNFAAAVDALTTADGIEPNNASVKKALQEALELKAKAATAAPECPLSPKKKTVYNTKTTTTSTTKPAVAKPAPTKAEKIEDDEDVDVSGVRGYKKLADGRVTTFFNNELSEADKALIGDIAPQKIQDATAVQIAAVEGGSAWNQGNTFEERDMTKFAHDRVTALVRATTALPLTLGGTAGLLAVKDVKDMSGEASIAVVRGAKRYIFDLLFTVDVEWAPTSGAPVKAQLKFIDMSSDCGGDYDVEVVVPERYTHPNGKDLHQALSSKAATGLQAALFAQLNTFVKEYQSN